jgi:hypothetical protein
LSALAQARALPVPGVRRAPGTGLLHGVFFLTILISGFVFIEPAPYEGVAALLGLVCVAAGVSFDRRLLPLLLLMIVWNVGGLIALVPVISEKKTIQYVAVSWFMAFTAVIFACLFARDTMRRLTLLRRAYVIAAVIASIIGAIGYFNIAGTAPLFATIGRANATFKDPNVFGPFLVLPALILVQSVLARGIRPLQIASLMIIMGGLLLSFSRGAWLNFALAGAIMMGLMFLTAPTLRARARLVALGVIVLAVLAALIMIALSFDAIGGMFQERAKLIQSYDAGTTMGRFDLQRLALQEMFDHPFGMGPLEFARVYGLQQHNVYLHAFLVYGWVGGMAYVVLVLLTLSVGLRAAFVATPWQSYMIAALAAFAAVAIEGLVIDTDHWRHYFLLVGLVWGLFVATERYVREAPQRAAVSGPKNRR